MNTTHYRSNVDGKRVYVQHEIRDRGGRFHVYFAQLGRDGSRAAAASTLGQDGEFGFASRPAARRKLNALLTALAS